MRYRPFGDAGFRVSEIGFGGWPIGGDLYGPIGDDEALETLAAARDRGINFYDTSDVYGAGHSEELIGRAFAACRREVVIATKGGFLAHYGPQDFSPQRLQGLLEASLRRLRSDYVDVYQLHSPPIELLASDELQRTLQDFVASGKVRVIGVSARGPNDGLVAIERHGIKALQINFNMTDQRALENGLIERCAERGVAFIARTPLCFGFLTGGIAPGARFDAGDHRAEWSEAQRDLWAQAPLLFERGAGEPERTKTQLALAFCLAFPGVASAIPGMMRPAEVAENAATADLAPLSPAAVAAIREVYRRHSFFLGKPAILAAASETVAGA